MRTIRITLLFMAVSYSAIGQELPPGFKAEKLFTGLNPTTFTFGPEGRIFLLNKSGEVLTINQDGALLPNPLVEIEVDDFNERGLSGITFHPRYEDFPYVYLYYTPKGENHNRVSRFKINGDQVIPNSEEIILELPTLTGFIHNGGRLKFDKEEFLYISVGDGANKWNAQASNSLLGKILRVDAEGNIPVSNPFFDLYEGPSRAIWSSGLRNPFSMDIHERSGQLFVGDVGDGRWEEINQVISGRNYGWPYQEGPKYPGEDGYGEYEEPYFAYDHDRGCAVVGVAIMDQPTDYPAEYEDVIFYADYCKGFIHYLDDHPEHDHLFASGFERPVDIQVSPEGELFVLTRKGLGGGSVEDNTSTQQGELWKISYIGDGPPQIVIQANVPSVVVGDNVQLDIKAFGSQPITYSWFRNDTMVTNSTDSDLSLEVKSLRDSLDQYYAVATNHFGNDTSQLFMLKVVNGHRPESFITQPTRFTYQALDTLHFEGFATDKEDGIIPDSSITWRIDFHHQEHTHPALDPTSGITGGRITIPAVTETDTQVWYRIHMNAVDRSLLNQRASVDILPKLTQFTVQGPPDCKINIDGVQSSLPVSLSTVKGVVRTLAAPLSYFNEERVYRFERWNAQSQNPLLITSIWNDTILEVQYSSTKLGEGSGLLARYVNDIDPTSSNDFTRIDSLINFNWVDRSPWLDTIREDQFSVVWSGYIEPLFDGEYTFSVFTDDGVKLWIADTLIIDAWVPQPPTENEGEIFLHSGVRYPIIMAYFEDLGFAVSQLSWEPPFIKKQIIPQRQLYPARINLPGIVEIQCWFDQNRNGAIDNDEPYIENVEVQIFDQGDSLLHTGQLQKEQYFTNWIQPGTVSLDIDINSQIFSYYGNTNETLEINSLDTTTVNIPLSINPRTHNLDDMIDFTIYPNPTVLDLNVELFSAGFQRIELKVINSLGQILQRQNLLVQDGLQKFQINTRELFPGSYQLILQNAHVRRSIPFIKNNP